jgi:hypothetical protein
MVNRWTAGRSGVISPGTQRPSIVDFGRGFHDRISIGTVLAVLVADSRPINESSFTL